MNVIFCITLFLGCLVITIYSPAKLLPTLLSGAERGAEVILIIFSSYCVWMAISDVVEQSNLDRSLSKYLSPTVKKVFKISDDKTAMDISMNIVCNALGLGSAATPLGRRAISSMQKANNSFGCNLLFILSATSIQLVPTTALSILSSQGAINASNIIIPSILTSALSSAIAILLFYVFLGRKG